MFKQLTEQDAGFLYLESPETPQHVGSVSFVELPPNYEGDFFEAYKRHVASRVHLNPLMHQKLVPLPLDLDHPFWAEDDQFDIDYHVRRQTVPRPGRLSQLEELVGRLHSNFLDRSRPLWEFYVIDGLESGQVAIYTKIHHAAMDGASSQNVIATLYDTTPQPRQIEVPAADAEAHTTIKVGEMLRGVAGHLVRQEVRALQFVPDALKAWASLVLPNAQTLQYDKAVLPPLITPKTLFNVAITSQRTYAARTLQLSRVKRVAKQADAKVNDVVLAVCSAALRRYLSERAALPRRSMTAMVPVSLHTADSSQNNQNAAVLCSLATHEADPFERLMRIRESMNDQKRLLGNIKNALFPDLSFLGSGALVRGALDLYRHAKLADKLPPLYNLVISNVAGPPVPLYVQGARVLSFNPCSIPFHSTALNITVESYCDSLDFGLIACRRTVPDLAELADMLPEAMDELERAVAAHAAAAAQPEKPAKPLKAAKPLSIVKTRVPARPGTKATAKTKTVTPATARPRRTRTTASLSQGERKRTAS